MRSLLLTASVSSFVALPALAPAQVAPPALEAPQASPAAPPVAAAPPFPEPGVVPPPAPQPMTTAPAPAAGAPPAPAPAPAFAAPPAAPSPVTLAVPPQLSAAPAAPPRPAREPTPPTAVGGLVIAYFLCDNKRAFTAMEHRRVGNVTTSAGKRYELKRSRNGFTGEGVTYARQGGRATLAGAADGPYENCATRG